MAYASESVGPRINAARVCVLALVAAGFASCGGGEDAKSASPPAARSKPEVRRSLTQMESQLIELENQSSAMRADVANRLDEIDRTKETLFRQVTQLREQILGSEVAGGAGARPAPASSTKASAAPAEAEKESRGALNLFLWFILIVAIIVPVAFMARLFFTRWGPDPGGEVFELSPGDRGAAESSGGEPGKTELRPKRPPEPGDDTE